MSVETRDVVWPWRHKDESGGWAALWTHQSTVSEPHPFARKYDKDQNGSLDEMEVQCMLEEHFNMQPAVHFRTEPLAPLSSCLLRPLSSPRPVCILMPSFSINIVIHLGHATCRHL